MIVSNTKTNSTALARLLLRFALIFALVSPLPLLLPSMAHAMTADEALAKIKRLDPKAAVILGGALGKSNEPIIALNSQEGYIPASVLKIPLVLSAYNILGDDFRFTTEFYKDRQDNLIIKGRGDPFMTSEEIGKIAAELKQLGHNKFNAILLDDNLFQGLVFHGLGESNNPYDAKFASLLVNFNTVNIQLSKTAGGNKIVSAEDQTPTLPLMQELGKTTKLVCCNKPERINLQGKDDYRRKYVAQLFSSIFAANAIEFAAPAVAQGDYELTKVTKKDKLLYTHRNSRPLSQVSEQLLLYSNNLIAMGVLLQFAPDAKNPIQASINRWKQDLRSIKGFDKSTAIHDGSGLDRRNKMSAESLYAILLDFTDYAPLLPNDAKARSLYKTGTLTGIYNLGGYIRTPNGIRPFVILTANKKNNRTNILNILREVD